MVFKNVQLYKKPVWIQAITHIPFSSTGVCISGLGIGMEEKPKLEEL